MNKAVDERNDEELSRMRTIAAGGSDRPVLMLNLNRYTTAADFPNGELYRAYMSVLTAFLPVVGAK